MISPGRGLPALEQSRELVNSPPEGWTARIARGANSVIDQSFWESSERPASLSPTRQRLPGASCTCLVQGRLQGHVDGPTSWHPDIRRKLTCPVRPEAAAILGRQHRRRWILGRRPAIKTAGPNLRDWHAPTYEGLVPQFFPDLRAPEAGYSWPRRPSDASIFGADRSHSARRRHGGRSTVPG
jgi:hypothetical protein